MSIPKKIIDKIYSIHTIGDMLKLLKSPYAKSERDFKPGTIITAYNKMDRGNYQYVIEAPMGDIEHPDFDPEFSPAEMLEMGIFEGKYLNDCVLEFPKEWFLPAIESGTLSPERPDPMCNYFEIKSRLSLDQWRKNNWIPQISGDPDNRGWFQWYCRYFLGRRIPKLDVVQIKRWRAFKRHYGAVKKNCDSLDCRPKQRQALLQWSYDAFVTK
jgi:hypothetical protein